MGLAAPGKGTAGFPHKPMSMTEDSSSAPHPSSPPQTIPPEALALIIQLQTQLDERLAHAAELRAEVERLLALGGRRRKRQRKSDRSGAHEDDRH